ncbi:MAG: alcohol dehydrogenase catalytic domain-containing protein [Planctomycetota bacterium]|nr:alcohol dehydrogenase catalytic domain-containing protein [Planctomycetota bacterium]
MTIERARRATLHGAGDVRIEPWGPPAPGPGELLLEVEAALLGGTVRKVVARGHHARMGTPPFPLGHEGAGRIVAVGDGPEGWDVGTRVVPANSAPCLQCAACRRAMTAQCEDMVWFNGLFATHVIVPARIATHNTYAVPEGLDARTAALAENLACVLKAKDKTPVRLGQPAVVVGGGPMGLLWTWALTLAGGRVTCIDPDPHARERAATFGATSALDPAHVEAPIDAPLVVEAVGTVEAWELAIRLARPGAIVHLFGGPPTGSRVAVDTDHLHYDELTLTASFHHTPFHFAAALGQLGAHGPALSGMIETTIGLDELPAYLASDARHAKVAVVP